MTTPFTSQIQRIEKAHKERHDKPLCFAAENEDLRLMIRNYCKKNGIDEIRNKITKEDTS